MKAFTRTPKPSIVVRLEQETIFVHPTKDDEPSEDPLIRGTALLTLPKRKAVKRITIKLDVPSDIYGGADYWYESSMLMQKSLQLNVNEDLEAGQHAFNFSFIWPTHGPVHQRSNWGRIRHLIKAFVDFNRSTTMRIASTSVPCYVVASSAPEGELPHALDCVLEHHSDELGPITLRLSSPHLTTSSLLSLHMSFLAPPEKCELQHVSVSVSQAWAVIYKSQKVAYPPIKRYTLGKVSATAPVNPLVPAATQNSTWSSTDPREDAFVDEMVPLQDLEPGQEFHYTAMFRVMSDDHLRPSTLKATNTNLRVNHRLFVEVRYRREGEAHDRILTIQRPVEIASCCCLAEYLSLPTYSAVPSEPTPSFDELSVASRRRCLCNTSFGAMSTIDRLAVARAVSIENDRSVFSESTGFDSLAGVRQAEHDAEERWRRDCKTAPVHVQGIEGRL